MIDYVQRRARHLSFSGMLQRADNWVLLTRPTFGGIEPERTSPVWSHSFFGAPRQAEPLPTAVRRSAESELGIQSMEVTALRPLLTAEQQSGPFPSEAHPSYVVESDENPTMPPHLETMWCDPIATGQHALRNPGDYSPLLVTHAMYLPFFGGDPRNFDSITQLKERATG